MSDIENMTDEEFEAIMDSGEDFGVPEDGEVPVEDTEPSEELPDPSELIEEPVDETESTEETDDTLEQTEDDLPDPVEGNQEDPDETTDDGEVSEESQESEEVNELDYKESYTHLMQPLKVSGKEVQVKSIDDARSLISMGIDYSRKMRDIKPLRAIGETLSEAGLYNDGEIDEAALMRLVDIQNGDRDALASLMREKSIDVLDIETDDVEYTPQTQMVSQDAIEIQEVQTKLEDLGTLNDVISAVSDLDDTSKAFFNSNPGNLLKLSEDIDTGVYDEVMGTIEYERSLGRLNGISDIDAYVAIARQKSPELSVEQPVVTEAPSHSSPSRAKRKAAGISNRAPVKKKTEKKYDYLNMSDEEFLALTPDIQY